MMKRLLLMILAASLLLTAPALAAERVIIETNYGNLTVELDTEKAPLTVATS